MANMETARTFTQFARVILPGGTPEALTYGIPDGLSVKRGSLVQVQIRNQKKLLPGLVCETLVTPPPFPVKPLQLHTSERILDESYVELVEWTAKYYCTTLGRTLDVFWPSDLDSYLAPTSQNKRRRTFHRDLAPPIPPPPLTPEQMAAVVKISPLLQGSGFRGILLHGVTGSGKTRVYLELVQKALDTGGRILILVPEISLTPQTRERFQVHLQEEILVLHSNLSAPERRHAWKMLFQGNARIVLGTRSALLVPGLRPSLILIDEEHDASYKQQDPAPRYHCREIAFHMAHRNHALVVLGSATPSLEAWEYARRGHLQLVQLKDRARPLPLPKVTVVDLKTQANQDRDLMISPPLREAIVQCLADGHQAILLHNRRGYATSRICLDCGSTAECQECKVPLIYHKHRHSLQCHYCGRLYKPAMPCDHCQGTRFSLEGGAIEKVEKEIQEWIPDARTIRLDKDSSMGIGSAERILQEFRSGTYNILLGTQMVAKGHDFPNVMLVGVISADTGSALPDFRASERTFQLLTQVAGRAGRAMEGGRVVLQSYHPVDPVLRFALRHDYEGFAKWELENRRELQYPPFSKLISLLFESKDLAKLDSFCEQLHILISTQSDLQVLGPADAFIPKVRGYYRKHFILKSEQTRALRGAAQFAENYLKNSSVRGILAKIDMDPQGFL